MQKHKIIEIIEDRGLEPVQAKSLLDNFGDYFVKAHKLTTKAKSINVTDVSQVDEMQEARELRIELKNLRVEADKTRILLKEGYLRGGNAVQEIFNDIKKIVKPEEDRLLDQEKFAQRIKEAEEEKNEQERINKLSQYVEDVSVFKLHPTELSTESFEKLLKSSKESYDSKIEAEKKVEADRIASEKAEREAQEKIRQENIKLKAEAETREKELVKERAEQQAKLDAERKAREVIEEKVRLDKLAEEQKLKAEAEKIEAIKKAEIDAEIKKQTAPDKSKLFIVSADLEVYKLPIVNSHDAKIILNEFNRRLQDLSQWLNNETKKI